MNHLFSIKDRVIVLTGGYGILGRCIAKHLAREGAKVAILGRNAEKGNRLKEEVRKLGGMAMFHAADVMRREQLEESRQAIVQAFGSIDVLINLAGGNMPGATIAPDQTFFDLDLDAFRQVIDLNLFGTVLPTMVFAETMVEQKKGSIINISSEASLRPLTRVLGYGCAKAAVNNFTRYLATELATKFGEGLRVNAIAPGFFLTEQNRALLTNPDGTPTERCQRIVAHTPYGRLGKPEELLGTVQWLAADASAFVTGTVIPVDGGFDAFSI
mgnify:FL=1